jgi:hypothetical protein
MLITGSRLAKKSCSVLLKPSPKIVHKYYLPIATAFFICSAAYGQFEFDSTKVYTKRRLHREEGSPFERTEKSIGLVPEIQGINNFFFGLGLSRANFWDGRWGGSARGATVSLEYNPFENIIAPKLNIWTTRYSVFLNGNIGLSGIYYITDDKSNFVLRPEIGLGFIKVFLNYGYNLFLDESISGLNRHTLTLSYYHTIYPWKKKR